MKEKSEHHSKANLTAWIPQSLRNDWKELRQGRVPTHLEVILRITVSSFLGYVLAIGNFPKVIPQSQRALIAMLGSTMGMLFPTLLFSFGKLMFPAMMVVTLLGLALATMLLACAAGVSLGFYVAMFGITALIISGMRFEKSTGAMTCFLVIEMALNSQPFARAASEWGLGFVTSLWTERGVTNPNAFYTNTLVGMMWVIFCMFVGRILPPFRTVRKGIVQGLLPASLEHVASSIDLNAEDLRLRLESQNDETTTRSGEVNMQGSDETGDKDTVQSSEFSRAVSDLAERREELTAKLIHDKSVLTDGKIAGLTAFEPRVFRCGPPECSWMALKALCAAIDRTVLASLALGEAWRDPHDLTVQLEQQLIPSHTKAAASLRKCAEAIKHNSKMDEEDVTDQEKKDEVQFSAVEGAEVVLDSLTVDPIFFDSVSREVVVATNDWADVAGPPDRTKSYFDKDARKAMKLNITPWIKGSIWYIVAIVKNCRTALSRDAWKRLLRPPYHNLEKVSWCADFTIGFTALVAMGVYWQEFKDLDNESWFIIAYAFSTTQTAEGTAKKGILRLIGTAAGGFSGWLALTACGEDGLYGLIAWLTVFTAIAAYVGLDRGFKARLGLTHDYGFGPAYFVMTQALVVVQVYIGEGDKHTITKNRIGTNAVGIAMAIVLALLPPALYGGNPKFAKEIWNQEKSLMVCGLKLLLEHTDSPESKATTNAIEEDLQIIRTERRAKISKLLEEANDFYSDSAKLRSWHLLTVDPKLKESLDSLQVIASWIFVSFGYALQILKDKDLGEQFLEDTESRTQLKRMLQELESGSGDLSFETLTLQDEEGGSSATTKSVVFANSVVLAIRKLQQCKHELDSIKYGLIS